MKSLILCKDPDFLQQVIYEILSGIDKPIVTNVKELKDTTNEITYTEDFPLEAESVIWYQFSLSPRYENRINDITSDLWLFPNSTINIDKYNLKDVKIFEVDVDALPKNVKTLDDALRSYKHNLSTNVLSATD